MRDLTDLAPTDQKPETVLEGSSYGRLAIIFSLLARIYIFVDHPISIAIAAQFNREKLLSLSSSLLLLLLLSSASCRVSSLVATTTTASCLDWDKFAKM